MESYLDEDFGFNFPQACGQCGSLTGVLSKLPAQSIPFSLVRSRYTPNTSDLPVIQGLISSSEVAIRLLEAELSQLQSRLSNIYTFKTFQGSLLAPIRRLPDELLGEIFAHAVGREGIDIGDKDSQIWDLWRVCARWRNIIRSTSSLWSMFHVSKTEVGMGTFPRRVLGCLKFSGKAPLSISLLPPAPYMNFFIPVVGEIAKHADRWLSLSGYAHIFNKATRATLMKTSIQQRGLAQLRTLLLDFESDTVFHLSVFKEAIGLKELTLQYAILNGAPEFPWANLRKLTIKLCHYNSEPENTFLSALQSMSLLEELEISTRDKITCASQIITLPSLHTLTIGHGDKSQIWSVLCTPKLSNIQMMNNVCGNIGSLSRMGTSMVQRLHLFCTDNTESFMIGVLKQLRDIEELHLINMTSNPKDVFKRLIWNPNSGSVQLLPLLQKIQLSLYYHETVEPTDFIQALLRIMRSRSPSSSAVMNQKPLPLLFVKCTVEATPSTYEEYDVCFTSLRYIGKEMGIKVEIVLQKGNEKLEWDMDEDFEDFEDDISM